MNNKKKILILIGITLLLMTGVAFGEDVSLWIDGDFVESDVLPFIENNRTLVPIRVISENLGYEVDWNSDTRTVEIEKEGESLSLTIDDPVATTKNEEITLDVAPSIRDNRTFVPIRLVAEYFDKEIDWDQDNRVVVLGQGYVPEESKYEQAKVVRVVDGDTIIVDRGHGEERLRFILVDTPETVHPTKPVEVYGKEASEFTKKSLENKTIWLEKDVSETDRYGRLLRYIWIEKPKDNPTKEDRIKGMFNAILLKEGYAQLSTFPPDIKHVEEFRQLEAEAREEGRGLWGFDEYKDSGKNNNSSGPSKYTDTQPLDSKYTGNSNSLAYHRPTCRAIRSMDPANRVALESKEEAENKGYKPCGICKP